MESARREVSPTVEADEFLTVREVARLLKISEVRVYQLIEGYSCEAPHAPA
jgi:predicted DNA-binding transcriptional regulator AlpA